MQLCDIVVFDTRKSYNPYWPCCCLWFDSFQGLDDLLTANLAKAIANTADAIDLDQQESQSQDDSVFQENVRFQRDLKHLTQ